MELELCVATHGRSGRPHRAPAHLGLDRLDGLVGRRALPATGRRAGRHVIRYDHRDTGQSTSYPAGAPGATPGEDLMTDAVAGARRARDPARPRGRGLDGRRASHRGAPAGGVPGPLILSLTLMSTSPVGPVEGALPPVGRPPQGEVRGPAARPRPGRPGGRDRPYDPGGARLRRLHPAPTRRGCARSRAGVYDRTRGTWRPRSRTTSAFDTEGAGRESPRVDHGPDARAARHGGPALPSGGPARRSPARSRAPGWSRWRAWATRCRAGRGTRSSPRWSTSLS